MRTPSRPGWHHLVAHDEQLLGTRVVRVVEGPGDGARVLEAWTPSGLFVDVLLDRAFDLFTVRFNGMPISWMGPPGLRPRTLYEPTGFGWLRTFHGGLLATCGLDHFGAPVRRPAPERAPPDERLVEFGEHGRIGHEAGRLVRCDVVAGDGGIPHLQIDGVVSQAALYGEQFELRRSIEIGIDRPTIRVRDVVTNRSPLAVPHATLYHINFGYPLVQPGTVIAAAGHGQDLTHHVGSCLPAAPETVASWDVAGDPQQRGIVAIRNPHGLGVTLGYSVSTLPAFFLWTLPRTRANVVGFAPASIADPSCAAHLAAGECREYDLLLTMDAGG